MPTLFLLRGNNGIYNLEKSNEKGMRAYYFYLFASHTLSGRKQNCVCRCIYVTIYYLNYVPTFLSGKLIYCDVYTVYNIFSRRTALILFIFGGMFSFFYVKTYHYKTSMIVCVYVCASKNSEYYYLFSFFQSFGPRDANLVSPTTQKQYPQLEKIETKKSYVRMIYTFLPHAHTHTVWVLVKAE